MKHGLVDAPTSDRYRLTVLIIGFALHNATEGFGIVGSTGGVTPSWRWLGLAGLIGGGPTFLGSLVSYEVTSGLLELSFSAPVGGAILYVIGEIWHGMRRYEHRELGLLLLAAASAAGIRRQEWNEPHLGRDCCTSSGAVRTLRGFERSAGL